MRLFQKIKNWKTVRGWHIWKLKLVDARLYFVSMIVGLLTGLIAVPYHYLLYYLLHIRSDFFASRPACEVDKTVITQHIPLLIDGRPGEFTPQAECRNGYGHLRRPT